MQRFCYGILCVFLVLSALTACGSPDELFGNSGYERFENAVEADRDYDVYWLGREVDAGDLVLYGPSVGVEGISEIEEGGLSTNYAAEECCGSLRLVMYTPSAWDRVLQERSGTRWSRSQPEVVTVAGFSAELRALLRQGGGLIAYVLTFDLGGTVVEATAGAADSGPQSPLADRDTFLAVMENLRPYPE